MEFTQNVAILQSAMQLAEKKCGCLGKLGKNGDPKVTVILTEAVLEVVQGVRGNLDAKKQEELQLKITAILLAVYLADKGKHDGDDFWFSVLQEMPSINSDVLFDLIKKCGLQKQLFKILSHVDLKLGLHIIGDLVDYIDLDTDSSDISLLVDLLDYLNLQDNPFLYSPTDEMIKTSTELTNSQLEVCAHLSRLSKGSSAMETSPEFLLMKDDLFDNSSMVKLFDLIPNKTMTDTYSRDYVTLLACVMNIISSVISGEGLLVPNTHYLSQPLKSFLTQKSLRGTFTPKEAQELFLETQDVPLTEDVVHLVKSKLKKDTVTLSHFGDIFMKMTLKEEKDFVNLDELTRRINSINTDSGTSQTKSKPSPLKKPQKVEVKSARIVSGHYGRMLLKRVLSLLDDNGECGLAVEVKTRCQNVLTQRQDTMLAQLGEKKWDLCCVLASGKLAGHKEFFLECLQEDLPKKSTTKFLEFMEGNLHLLNSSDVMKKWLYFVSRLVSQEKKSMTVTSIRMITLAAYRKLPLVAQAAIILFAYEELNMKLVFGGSEQLKMKTTTAFNRLVKAQGNLKTSIGAVSELLLQAPEQTLQKMIHEAVYKNGLARMMAEIIESLPTLGQLKLKNNATLLGHLIGQAAAWKLSRTEEQNLLSFVTHLFKMSGDGDMVFLPRVQLVRDVVLPNLVQTVTEDPDSTDTNTQPPQKRVLSLLYVAMETTPDTGCDWVLKIGACPLVLCLIELLDDCCLLFDTEEDEGAGKQGLKELLVTVVTLLVEWLVKLKDNFTAKTLAWLYNSLLQLNWTALLYTAPLFTAVDSTKYPMRLPDSVLQLSTIPEGWTTFPYTGLGDAVYLTLEAVRVPGISDLLRPVDTPQFPSPDLYTRAVAALALLLPHSLASESVSMVAWLLNVGACKDLKADQIITHAHTESKYEGVMPELSVCRLLDDVLRVLGESGMHDASLDLNLHVAQTHVVLIRTYCLRPSSSTDSTHCLLLTEVFCRLCHQMALFAAGCAEPLYVLLLDILQTYSTKRTEVIKSIDDPNIKGLSQDDRPILAGQVEFMAAAAELCPPEERSVLSKTLLQLE